MGMKFADLKKRYNRFSDAQMVERSADFLDEMKQRRTIRFFSDKPVPREIIENCIRSASTAPSGANCQPWHFVAVSDPEIKKRIRQGSEKIEKEFYGKRAPKEWLDALAPLGTNQHKPFLDDAHYLIVIFAQRYRINSKGDTEKNYYINESIGISTGMLITALHHAGLGTLTYTPSPMGFLNKILGRPENERPYLVLVVGHPSNACSVPDLDRKPLQNVATFM